MVRERHGRKLGGAHGAHLGPATRTEPLVGLSRPATRFSSVDLPEPDGPITP